MMEESAHTRTELHENLTKGNLTRTGQGGIAVVLTVIQKDFHARDSKAPVYIPHTTINQSCTVLIKINLIRGKCSCSVENQPVFMFSREATAEARTTIFHNPNFFSPCFQSGKC